MSRFASAFKSTLFFLYILLLEGFVLGTFLLTILIRKLVVILRENMVAMQIENIVVSIIIILYVIFSIFLAKWTYRWLKNYARKKAVIFFQFFLISLFAYSLYYWFNPKPPVVFGASKNGQFTLGSYPDLNGIFELKRAKYTTIVSLLNPAIPFEAYLLKKEEKNVQLAGLKLISLPMLPWVMGNQSTAPVISEMVQQSNEKYYVHCFLGEDRTRAFLDILSRYTPITTALPKTYLDKTVKSRQEFEAKGHVKFDQGEAFALNNNILLGQKLGSRSFAKVIDFYQPELIIYILRKEDLNDEEVKKYELLSQNVQVVFEPMEVYPYDPYKFLQLADHVKTLNKKIFVDDYFIPGGGFLLSYLTGLPAIPPNVFYAPLINGAVEQIAPNIVLGPQLEQPEYQVQIKNKGFKGIIYVGSCEGVENKQFQQWAANAKLGWQCFMPTDSQLIDVLSRGGPWYVFGPDLETIKPTLKNKFKIPYAKLLKKYDLLQ